MVPTEKTKQLRAFHNDLKIKEKYLERITLHEKADEIQHGFYWQNGKGCAVGCTIEGNEHKKYETELGIPEVLARLEDALFEIQTNGDAKTFPRRFLEAIPVGAKLYLVAPKFIVYVLNDVLRYCGKYENCKKAILDTAELWQRIVDGKVVTKKSWSAARSAAWSAAESAARSAAESAARSAAWSAAESAAESVTESAARSVAESAARSAARSAAESAAESVTESAARSAAWSAARSVAGKRMGDKLIELLKEATKI